MDLLRFLFSVRGRLDRTAYWIFFIVLFAVTLPLEIWIRQNPDADMPGVYLAVILIILWPSIAVQAKRWHDIDMSALWILINLVPIIGSILSLVANGFIKGTQGGNRFGGDPLE